MEMQPTNVPGAFTHMLSGLDSGEAFALMVTTVIMLTGMVIAVTAIVSYQWRRIRQRELEHAFKQELLDRGLSAEEIEKVINAGNQSTAGHVVHQHFAGQHVAGST